MPDLPPPKPLWTAAEIASAPRGHIKHPWNPNSDIYAPRSTAHFMKSAPAISWASPHPAPPTT